MTLDVRADGDADAPGDEQRLHDRPAGACRRPPPVDGVAVLTPLVGQTLTAALPEGVRLADVPLAAM